MSKENHKLLRKFEKILLIAANIFPMANTSLKVSSTL
jgi:hypothetical protein